jgi:putative spermidine/putrescine transport system permease protein
MPTVTERPSRTHQARTRSRNLWSLLLLPNLILLIVFYGYPILEVLKQSVTDFIQPQRAGLDNYAWFFGTPVNVRVLARTLVTAAAVTIGALVLAFPYAYYMTVVGPKTRRLLMAIVLVPFWTSIMVRNFAWIVMLQPNGPINGVLRAIGLGQLHLLGSVAGVAIGEIQILLPFVVLPLYARLRTIDRSLLAAAGSLGAPPWQSFARIYLPLSLPGVLAGGLLTFVLSLGFYITPALLGSSRQQLLSPLIVTQVSQSLALGRGGAMATVLLVATFVLVGLTYRISRGNMGGADGSAVEPGRDPDDRRRHPILAAATIVIAVVLVLPSLVAVPMSLTAQKTFSFPPSGWSLRWWHELFADDVWLTALLRSLTIAVATAIVATVLGTAAALGVSRGAPAFRSTSGVLFLLPLVAPLVVAAIGIYSVFLRWHLTGTFVGFLAAHTALAVPYVIVPVASALRGFDRRLESAAASLGATPWSTFRRVTLPLILPSVLAGMFFAFATSLDETVVSLFLVSPDYRTLPVQIFTSITRDVDPTVAAASTIVFAITTLLVFIMFAVQVRQDRKGASV